jgi:hypothetical protein
VPHKSRQNSEISGFDLSAVLQRGLNAICRIEVKLVLPEAIRDSTAFRKCWFDGAFAAA